MNKQDEKIIELYIRDIRKKRIILFIIIVIVLISCVMFCIFYKKNIKQDSDVNNEINIQEENEKNTLDETIYTVVNDTENIETKPTENSAENSIEISTETLQNTTNSVTIEKKNEDNNINQKSKEKQEQKPIPTASENKKSTTSKKPQNKDFLFTDGYTIENVSQVAQDYLKASGYSGECIPLKDNEGIYYGMRVVFH